MHTTEYTECETTAAAVPPNLLARIEEISQLLDEMGKAVVTLENRLDPVLLRTDRPEWEESPLPSRSPLHDHLWALCTQADWLRHQVLSIAQRVDL